MCGTRHQMAAPSNRDADTATGIERNRTTDEEVVGRETKIERERRAK